MFGLRADHHPGAVPKSCVAACRELQPAHALWVYGQCESFPRVLILLLRLLCVEIVGFVLASILEYCARLVVPFAESHDPYVCYGFVVILYSDFRVLGLLRSCLSRSSPWIVLTREQGFTNQIARVHTRTRLTFCVCVQLAVGIACAGTGLQEAIDLLEPMTKDATDFVRQVKCLPC